ncbi:MAG: hypothetical protein KKE44_24675 [Proteobacteria bacterium]|nr:hypothetical protein [Pseudomonadota bacterium]MBU1585926.1 hypothetical protein [Pseudomonadota bacterium]MBU2455252.1 hypothetical protein [Pseudomonadota bacterium]MBU2628574.1 hypothetical protein [Pseudomonadota bacterium]
MPAKSQSNNNSYNHLPESLPGFDLQDGLDRVGSDKEFFLELLILFKKALSSIELVQIKKQDEPDAVQEQPSENNFQELFETIQEYKPFIEACKAKKCKRFFEEIKSQNFPKNS